MMISTHKYAIITATDKKYGDFLIDHWLNSLIDNINRNKVDIIVMDYGLDEEQKKKLLEKKVKVIACKKDGHVVNIRYRDIHKFLKNNYYEQIMNCDGGDIIFQKDITKLFEENKKEYRAVCEDLDKAASNMVEYALLRKCFVPKLAAKMIRLLEDKKPINGGVILAPYKKFIKLCLNMEKMILNKNIYGPDQIILNYTLYSTGFIKLDKTYNYTLFNSEIKFKIRNGVFFDENSNKIAIVHNSGATSLFRVIRNFGYGEGYNQIKPLSFFIFNLYYKIFDLGLAIRLLRKSIGVVRNPFS